MNITVQNKYKFYINAGGFSIATVQAIADDIGGKLIKAFNNSKNTDMMEIVTVREQIDAYIFMKHYNTYITQQIITQLLDYIDEEDGLLPSLEDLRFIEQQNITNDPNYVSLYQMTVQ